MRGKLLKYIQICRYQALIPLTWEKIWRVLLMGHHLPPTHANILYRKNTGQCPIYLEVRKFDQCHRPMYLSSDTDNNHISKTELTLSIRFCDKVTTSCHQWGNILTRALHAPVGSWAPNVSMFHAHRSNPVPSLLHAMRQEICKSECGVEAPWRRRILPVLLPSESHGPRTVISTYYALNKLSVQWIN